MRYFGFSFMSMSDQLQWCNAAVFHVGVSWPSMKFAKETALERSPPGYKICHVTQWNEVSRKQFEEIMKADNVSLETLTFS
jgi:hypothetical protein